MRKTSFALLASCSAFALVLLAAAPASAQEEAAAPAEERPWAKGVSPENQQAAIALFTEANQLMQDALFKQAAEKYMAALSHWEHPAIHYNLAFALMNLDQPVEVFHHLEKAVSYGAAPLDEEKFDHANSYKNLIQGQLARLEISCDTEGAVVNMDGAQLFTAPGKWEGLVRAGRHTITASAEGYIPKEKSVAYPPGETTKVNMNLRAAGTETVITHKWATWKPWVVVGAGAAVLLAGGVLTWQSQSAFDDFDAAVDSMCQTGCTPSPDMASDRDRGETLRTLSIVAYVVGGATLITGATLVYINRGRPVRINPYADEDSGVSIVPLLSPDEAGVMATVRF